MHAALLLIGNELLSGKIQEANLAHLARTLRSHGVSLRRSVMVPDEVATIEAEVRALSMSHTWLFTSGGVGPTHDDVTMAAVARAFDMEVVLHPHLAAMIRGRYGDQCTAGHLRMAQVPSGAFLETSLRTLAPAQAAAQAAAPAPLAQEPEADEWPAVRIGNTWVLPGVPEAFRMKLEIVAASLRRSGGGPAFVTHAVYTQLDEAALIPALDAVVAAFPSIDVGSYPKWFDPTYRTKLTFDGRDEAAVRAARDAFVALLPPGEPQRIE
jgi:molybdenum cofactor synthesis domain-containing protein